MELIDGVSTLRDWCTVQRSEICENGTKVHRDESLVDDDGVHHHHRTVFVSRDGLESTSGSSQRM